MNVKTQFKEGLLTKNPVTVQLLGMCSTMAITTMLFNGIGMGISVLIILTCSNIVISLLRKVIPPKIRIACYIVVIAGFACGMLLAQLVQELFNSLMETTGGPLINRGYSMEGDISNRRLAIWRSGLELGLTRPVTGISFPAVVAYAKEHLPDTYIISNDLWEFNTFDSEPVNIFVSQGIIDMMTGVRPGGEITGVSIVSHSETAGLGAVYAGATDTGVDFRESFAGKSGTIGTSDVDYKSGATISAEAICKGASIASQYVAGLG